MTDLVQLIESQNYDTIKIGNIVDRDLVVLGMIDNRVYESEMIVERASSSFTFWCATEHTCLEIAKTLITNGAKFEYEFKQLGRNNYMRMYPEEE